MEVICRLDEIIKILGNNSFTNFVAIASLIVATIALFENVRTNRRNNKQYIDSIKPLLSFDFYEKEMILLLSIKNNGKTEAKDIKIDVINLENNGNNELVLDDLFGKSFELYPTEEVQGMIGYLDESITKEAFPKLNIKVSYFEGSGKKRIEYDRVISFRKEIYSNNNLLYRLNENIDSISYSNNRIANYLEGKALFKFDKINSYPNSSLYEDMKKAIGNIQKRGRKNKNVK